MVDFWYDFVLWLSFGMILVYGLWLSFGMISVEQKKQGETTENRGRLGKTFPVFPALFKRWTQKPVSAVQRFLPLDLYLLPLERH